jgi:O-antigen ligase
MTEYSKEEKILMVIQFLAVYSITSIVSNAVYSIATTLFILVTLVWYWKEKHDRIIWPDKLFCTMYLPFFILIILSSILIGYKDSVMKALDFTGWSVIPFSLFYFGMQKRFFDKAIIIGIIAGVWTLGIVALYQYIVLPDNTRIQSYLSHPNYLAEMLELSIPFLILFALAAKNQVNLRIASSLSALMACFVLALTACRGGILGLIVGAIIYLFVRLVYTGYMDKKKVLMIIGAIILISCFVAGIFHSGFTGNKGAVRSYDHERILLWESSYAMWNDHKLTGVGLKHWQEEYLAHYISPYAKEPQLIYPHNIYMFFFSESGSLGGIGMLFFTVGIFFYLCRLLKKNPNNIFLNALLWSFLAIMLHGQVDAGITSKFVMRLYSTYLGIGLASVAYHERLLQNKNELE